MTVFNEKIIDVTKGNIWTGIWKLSWPMLLIMIFSFFVGLTDVYVAGFKTAEDGQGVILRLYEGAGLATSAVINLRLPGVNIKMAALCDGCERMLSPLAPENNSLRIALKPWETSTVRILAD